jgi:hypothetical protein
VIMQSAAGCQRGPSARSHDARAFERGFKIHENPNALTIESSRYVPEISQGLPWHPDAITKKRKLDQASRLSHFCTATETLGLACSMVILSPHWPNHGPILLTKCLFKQRDIELRDLQGLAAASSAASPLVSSICGG